MEYAYFNGAFLREKDLNIHVSDLAFHRAYGIFDFFKLKNGKNPWIEWYLDRFFSSAEMSLLQIPYSKEDIKTIVSNLLNKNGVGDSCIKLLLTGGYSADGFTLSQKSNFVVLTYPVKPPPALAYKNGVKLLTAEYQRPIPGIKSIDYFFSVLMSPELQKAGAMDVLYHDNHHISETSRSNIFIVKEDKIFTPRHNILKGVTRKRVLSLAEDFDISETEVSIDDLTGADEVFITSTTKGVIPVSSIDNLLIGTGKPGHVTQSVSNHILRF